MKDAVRIAGSAVLAFAIAGFGAYALAHTSASATGRAERAGALAVGDHAPDFSVEAANGGAFSMAAHAGRPTLVFAFFGGCAECVPAGRTLVRIERAYGSRGVEVVGLDILDGEATSTIEQYGDFIGANFPLAAYNAGAVRAYGLDAPEITYVIGSDGTIADINHSALTYEQYARELDNAL